MKLIAITGGIGSGKSVVARMAQVMGYEVYDCDSRAKALMVEDRELRHALIQAFGNGIYMADGNIDRQRLSAIAFSDKDALARLNALVHPATARDMKRWAEHQAMAGASIAFVETALLRTAGLDKHVDAIWHVTAPAQVRIERVMTRSGLTAEQVTDRIAAQQCEDSIKPDEQVIINDNVTALLPQIIGLLNQLKTTNHK